MKKIIFSSLGLCFIITAIFYSNIDYKLFALSLKSFKGYQMFSYPLVHLDFKHFFENLASMLILTGIVYHIDIKEQKINKVVIYTTLTIGLTTLIIFPTITIMGTSGIILSLVGALAAYKNNFIKKQQILVIGLIAILVKYLTSGNIPQFMLHTLGFFTGYMVINKKKRILK